MASFRHSIAYIDALPQLCLLGLLIGVLTGFVIVLFRYLVEIPAMVYMDGNSENFEELALSLRVGGIFVGCFILAIFMQLLPTNRREVGVSHVVDRLHSYQGQMSWRNWLVQFFAGAIAIGSGQSVGREGPVVHLGGGVGSFLGSWLRLPNNSMNTLVACGAAAGISASFDTPMAGVIFAMEVIVMEYTIAGFLPVMLASVVGTVISQAAFGEPMNIRAEDLALSGIAELPFILLVGVIVSICGAVYIRLNLWARSVKLIPVFFRIIIAGALTAVVAISVPEVMGLGYDTLNASIAGQLGLFALLTIALAKLVLTPIVIGLGIPGGLIGPMLVIGACVGGVFGLVADMLFAGFSGSPGFYVMLGMVGMMAATLNAPLAALVAILELSSNPNIIFPAMLVIVVACLSIRHFFRYESIFTEQLKASGRRPTSMPAKQILRRVGVLSVLDHRIQKLAQQVTVTEARACLSSKPEWLLFDVGQQMQGLYAADLAAYLETQLDSETKESANDGSMIDLLEIPARRRLLLSIHETATLWEAWKTMNNKNVEAVYVRSLPTGRIAGLLTIEAVENYYHLSE